MTGYDQFLPRTAGGFQLHQDWTRPLPSSVRTVCLPSWSGLDLDAGIVINRGAADALETMKALEWFPPSIDMSLGLDN